MVKTYSIEILKSGRTELISQFIAISYKCKITYRP